MASSKEAEGLDTLVTEARRADTDYASRSTQDLVGLMNEEDASVPAAVAAVADELAAAIDAIVARLAARRAARLRRRRLVRAHRGARRGGMRRNLLHRAGQVVALVAGAGLSSAEREAAEDDAAAGRRAVEELAVAAADAVVGVSASGRTPYALARARGCRRGRSA